MAGKIASAKRSLFGWLSPLVPLEAEEATPILVRSV
jgi:hypothetical protein